MVLWSASEHLVVEAPVGTPNRPSARRWITSVALLLLCAGVLTYFLARSPEPAREITVAASSTAAWLHADAQLRHTRLRLITLVQYGGNTALLQVATKRGQMQITLHRDRGLWRGP
jgi:hypothetical protein